MNDSWEKDYKYIFVIVPTQVMLLIHIIFTL